MVPKVSDAFGRTGILTRQFRYLVFVNDQHGRFIKTHAGLLDQTSSEEWSKAETKEETAYYA